MAEIVSVTPRILTLSGDGFRAQVSTSRMTRKNWLKIRRHGVGGSDVGKLIYPSKWGGPLSLYMEKISTEEPEDEGSDYTDYGTILEEALRGTYLPTALVRYGIPKKAFEIYRSPFVYVSADKEWEMANIDGLVEFKQPVEINGIQIPAEMIGAEFKTAGFQTGKQWDDNSIPETYYCQVQWYMGVLNLNYFIVLVLIDRRPEVRIIVRNQDYIDAIRGRAESFWLDNVKALDPPLATGADADLEALSKLFPAVQKEELVEVETLDAPMRAYLAVKDKISELTDQKNELEAVIKQAIGDNKGAYSGDLEAKWSRWESERFDSKTFKEKHPELAGQYIKTVIGGRLDIRNKGEK